MDADTTAMILTQQRNLTMLKLGSLRPGVPLELCSQLRVPFELFSIRTLTLPEIGSAKELSLYQRMIHKAPRLESLSLQNVSPSVGIGHILDWDDNQFQDGIYTRSLFGHRVVQRSLKELRLTSQHLIRADRTFMRAIRFETLHRLTLSGCSGMVPFLHSLAHLFLERGSMLKKLAIDIRKYPVDTATFNHFMQSFRGLEDIHVDVVLPLFHRDYNKEAENCIVGILKTKPH